MSKEHVSLTAAECASQTGLTVKALRVYERYGLITPRRTAKGWRHYGAEDLMRLNTITVLKAAGLTLVQIRETINQQNPSLEQVLRVQIEAWKSRRADAERGQALAELSLERLQTHQSISVDDLCNLVRSLEMSSTNRAIKEAFERHMTAEEQQAWTSGEAARNHDAYIDAQRTQIFPELEKLITAGYEATSPEVQALVDRNSQLMTQYRIRELGLQQSTSEIVLKAMRARTELALQAQSRPGDPELAHFYTDPKLSQFLIRAQLQSARRKHTRTLLQELTELAAKGAAVTSPEVQAVVARYREVCSQHSLGDPLVFAQWSRQADRMLAPDMVDSWGILEQALRVGG